MTIDHPNKRRRVVKTLVLLSALILLFEAYPIIRNSYVYNENGRLASGLIKLSRFDFSPFRVNPPLPDVVAALPARLSGAYCPERDELGLNPLERTEYTAGSLFFRNANHLLLLRLGRFCELIFTLIGVVSTYYYARWLFNARCGAIAAALWLFSPMMNGHGGLISHDIAGAALAIASCALFHYWLKVRRRETLFLCGLVLGVAQLCKTTLLVLYPIFFVLWLLFPAHSQSNTERPRRREAKLLFLHCFATSILIINIGYLFEGTFTPLGDFAFQSKLLSKRQRIDQNYRISKLRFKDSILGKIPVPLPENYVLGIDLQRFDFEIGLKGASYMRGRYAERGWFSYYAYALLVKTPVGTIVAFFLALGALALSQRYRLRARDELALWLPGLTIFLFVSSQRGFSVHSRYILPALPFFFVAVSRLGLAFSPNESGKFGSPKSKGKALRFATIVCGLWTIVSFASAYPDELAYFNELAALIPTPLAEKAPLAPLNVNVGAKIRGILNPGLAHGRRHLIDSNLDWGQNDLVLLNWLKERPEICEIKTALWGSYPDDHLPVPESKEPESLKHGWFAISVNHLYDRERKYRYLLEYQPYYVIDNCIYVFHLPDGESSQ